MKKINYGLRKRDGDGDQKSFGIEKLKNIRLKKKEMRFRRDEYYKR